ncbi:MAG: NAD(P)H-binding protein, partial [Marinobacter sp.]
SAEMSRKTYQALQDHAINYLRDGKPVILDATFSTQTVRRNLIEELEGMDADYIFIDESGVKRFVMLSSIGADQSNPTGDIAPYLNAKHEADEYLKASGMTYSILRPVALTNNGRSKEVILGEEVDKSAKASRADVAYVLAEAATTGRHDGLAQNMQSA